MRPHHRQTFRDSSLLLKAWVSPSIKTFQLSDEQLERVRSAKDSSAELGRIYSARKAAQRK